MTSRRKSICLRLKDLGCLWKWKIPMRRSVWLKVLWVMKVKHVCISLFSFAYLFGVSGDPVPPVWIWGQVYLHLPHTGRASNLLALKFLQICSFCWRDACEFILWIYKYAVKTSQILHNTPSRKAPHQLTKRCCEELDVLIQRIIESFRFYFKYIFI